MQTPEYRRQYRKEQQLLLFQYKLGIWCAHCGENDYRCLDFHHIDPSTKSFSIGNQEARSFQSILKEIQKCIVLCSNCHRKEHERINN